MVKTKGQNSSVNKSKGKGKGKKQTKDRGKGKSKDKQKPTKGKSKDKGKDKGTSSPNRQGQNEWKRTGIPTSPQSQKARHERFQFKYNVSSWFGAKTMKRKIWRLSMRERRSSNRSRTSVGRKFKEIMEDARDRDWKNLAHFSNLRQSVYAYDHESKSVRNPRTVWLLSAFH